MIIAIDETGDFNPESNLFSFFVAVILDQSDNGILKKKAQFDNWLSTIPTQKINEKNEVKGSDLDDFELESFVKTVYNLDPVVRKEIMYFSPKENPETLMKYFKQIEVERFLKIKELCQNEGKFDMAKQYEKMSIWYKNAKKMHYPHYFKIVLLENLIPKALNTAIGCSILLEMLHDKNHENLLNLEFKIDQDFIRGNDPTIYWKELLRNFFITSTYEKAIPLLDTWKNGHPFIDKYKHKETNKLNFKDLFVNHCSFLESHLHFEIQIADITGIIINRYHNRGKAKNAYIELHKVLKTENMTKLILNEYPNTDINPIIIN